MAKKSTKHQSIPLLYLLLALLLIPLLLFIMRQQHDLRSKAATNRNYASGMAQACTAGTSDVEYLTPCVGSNGSGYKSINYTCENGITGTLTDPNIGAGETCHTKDWWTKLADASCSKTCEADTENVISCSVTRSGVDFPRKSPKKCREGTYYYNGISYTCSDGYKGTLQQFTKETPYCMTKQQIQQMVDRKCSERSTC